MALSVLLPELSTTGSNGFVMLNVFDLMYTWPPSARTSSGLSCSCVLLSQLGRGFLRKSTDSVVEYLDCDLFFEHATKKSLAHSGRELA